MSPDLEYDVVVVGAGIAGITTALSLQQSGASVALLEKMDAVGGSSAMSGGFFAFSGTEEQKSLNVEDSEAQFREDLIALGDGAADEQLIDAYLANQQDTYRWLKDNGVEFHEIEVSSGQSAARSHHTDIKKVLAGLAESFKREGGGLLLGHAVLGLLTDGERVTGVTVSRAGKVWTSGHRPGWFWHPAVSAGDGTCCRRLRRSNSRPFRTGDWETPVMG